MQSITLEVILRAVFGLVEGGQVADLAARIVRLLSFSSPLLTLAPKGVKKDLPLSPYRRFLTLRAAVDEPLYRIIAERRSKPAGECTDILSLLLATRDEEGRGLTDRELRDELITLLLAGHETSATTLAWVIERVLVEPGVPQRLEAELDAVIGDGPLQPSHLPRLEYLDAVIKETLRLRPILPVVGRKVMRELTLGGYSLPPGVLVVPCIYLAQRRPQTYPEPEQFRPERFLEAKADPYAWLPFGGGMRRCIGMAFALYEIKIVLATLLGRVRLRLTHPGGERVVRRQILLAPHKGTEVVVTGPRTPAAPARTTA
jgi:cytochrome P450